MTSLIVISFTNDEIAIKAAHKLDELESYGEITIYERVIASKNIEGESTILQTQTSDGMRTLTGMTLGTVIGGFGGPIGLLIGLFSGALIGGAVDADYYDFSDDFIKKTIGESGPGTVMLIAEIYEADPNVLDGAMESFGATVSRSNVDYVHEGYEDARIQQIEDDISAEREKIKSAASADKTRIEENIARLKDKRHKSIEELKQKNKTIIARIKALADKEKRAHLIKMINRQEEKTEKLEAKLKKLDE